MTDINWVVWTWALVAGLLVGVVVVVAGLLIDKARERSWRQDIDDWSDRDGA